MNEANNALSIPGNDGLIRSLDRAEVLAATVAQLRKDLTLSAEELPAPAAGENAAEVLRNAIAAKLEEWTRTGSPALSRAVNRVDLTERMVTGATDRGGLGELAGTMVLRCLQKVLLRKHFAARE